MQTPPERGITITIPLTPQEAWGLLIMAFILGAVLIGPILRRTLAPGQTPLGKMREALGLNELPEVIVIFSTALWLTVLLTLLGGLLWTILQVAVQALPQPRNDLLSRLPLLTLAGLTATLGAVIALPFTLIKRLHSARQTDATEEGLITDRINTAVLGLSTEKTVKRQRRNTEGELLYKEKADGTPDFKDPFFEEITEPNIEVRVGAILALERLAKNNLDFHVQIMQMLCTYIRANAPAKDATAVPQFPLGKDWLSRAAAWRKGLDEAIANLKSREDIFIAMQVIGRRTPDQRKIEAQWGEGGKEVRIVVDTPCPMPPQHPADWNAYRSKVEAWAKTLDNYRGYRLDLRETNLQKLDLSGLNFSDARFDAAQMQGANLDGARMQGANFDDAQMQGANLRRANMRGARLNRTQISDALLDYAQMQGANLEKAQMQYGSVEGTQMRGANLGGSQMQGATLVHAEFQGANLNGADMQHALLLDAKMQGASLNRAQMSNAILDGAQMQGASLREAQAVNATFYHAKMQGAIFPEAKMQGAGLNGSKMQGAILDRADMLNVSFEGVQMDATTSLDATVLKGATFKDVDLTNVAISLEQIQSIFGDDSTILPGGKGPKADGRPDHWPKENLDYTQFDERWRAWRKTLGTAP